MKPKSPVLEIIQSGPLTTVQDLGRPCYQQYGVPVSGAMDRFAFAVANGLVQNPPTEACLEITMYGLVIKALAPTTISMTGADMQVTYSGSRVGNWCSLNLNPGDILEFQEAREGARAYLGIAGGIDCPIVLGSRSTYVKGRFGGIEGRPLRAGDIIRGTSEQHEELRLSQEKMPHYREQMTARVVLGPQDDHFTKEGISTFFSSEYVMTSASDRMGYRLSGPEITHTSSADIISDGIPWGAIQVPGDRMPIIMMVDRQTTGGYPKIATAITADLPGLAQSKPGDTISFAEIEVKEARSVLLEYQENLSLIISSLKQQPELQADLQRRIRLQGSIR